MEDKYREMVMRAWDDADFKARLISDPRSVMKEAGVDVPEGFEINVIEDTPGRRTFILPPPPPSGELSEDELTNVAGGASYTDPGFAPSRAASYTDPGFAPARMRGGDDIRRRGT